MPPTVPIIFTPPVQPTSVTKPARLLGLGVAVASLGVLVVAATLAPSPTGVGTHRRMGYPECQFLDITGLPCPTCGMTTSFAHFVRGNWLASLYIQPMGFVMALGTAAAFWAGLYIAITGRPIHRLLGRLPLVLLIAWFMGLGIAAWGWKIFTHLRGMDGWN